MYKSNTVKKNHQVNVNNQNKQILLCKDSKNYNKLLYAKKNYIVYIQLHSKVNKSKHTQDEKIQLVQLRKNFWLVTKLSFGQ